MSAYTRQNECDLNQENVEVAPVQLQQAWSDQTRQDLNQPTEEESGAPEVQVNLRDDFKLNTLWHELIVSATIGAAMLASLGAGAATGESLEFHHLTYAAIDCKEAVSFTVLTLMTFIKFVIDH
ncbi:hypothetical protein GWK47_031889 [Chionoecetes opilio]|uniref:Uncharacterized protein n=1 Tax=Chionoecetes opilio TaxID=41210 RepID=A0A8J4YQQ2_CHIOP|nr:hypothetical protein GWK47_031889 [Chionoecetes opilio]